MLRFVFSLALCALVLSCSKEPPVSPQPTGKITATQGQGSVALDRAVLGVFYHATRGDDWDNNRNWLSSAALKYWHGVETDANGRVTALWITSNNLHGFLPVELFLLDQLKELVVVNNPKLRGSIPSTLGNLSTLERLRLAGNGLTGPIPSSLSKLWRLKELGLQENRLTGSIPSSLSKLFNLRHLWLRDNQLTGSIPSQLGQLSLQSVFIRNNRLTGCMPPTWRNVGQSDLEETSLAFCDALLPDDPIETPDRPFSIELVFLRRPGDYYLSQMERAVFERAARRWEEVIASDVQDVDFRYNPYHRWSSVLQMSVEVKDKVDDLRIFVRVRDLEESAGTGGTLTIRLSNKLPILGAVAVAEDVLSQDWLYDLVLHEIGHALGIGTVWDDQGLLKNPSAQNPNADTHFAGPLARALFVALGGGKYRGASVPVQQGGDDGHWRQSVFGDELMIAGWVWPYNCPLSAITLASLEDVGYRVRWDKADPYTLPKQAAAKPVEYTSRPRCHIQPQPISLSDEQGRMIATIQP